MQQRIREPRTIKIELQEKPPSVNHIWKISGKRKYKTKEGNDFMEKFHAAIPQGIEPIKGDCSVFVWITFPDKLRRDIDNYLKGILDGMNKIVFEDDSQIQELHVYKDYRYKKPNILVIVKEI